MCLLVMALGLDPETPLLVAANRDERLDRRATPMAVLAPGGPGTGSGSGASANPRILGGRDEEAGGTWLAVNEHGLVAGLTNRPLPDGRDPTKRSRGALPLLLAGHRTAVEAVEDFLDSVSPTDYNPAWFLVGDRRSLFAIDLSAGERPTARSLDPGLHVLENAPLGAPSQKADQVRSLLGHPSELAAPGALEKLRSVLADHTTPDLPAPEGRRPETLAACVHTEDYGTRSSTLIGVHRQESVPPTVLFAEGHPCTAEFLDASDLWTSEALPAGDKAT